MPIKTVTVDYPVWLRDTHEIDLPDGLDDEAAKDFIDKAIENKQTKLVDEGENRGEVHSASVEYKIDGEDL